MKIIELLNKIANGKEVPLIKYRDKILHWNKEKDRFEDKYGMNTLYEMDFSELNDEVEVEIIEEDKKDKFTGWRMYQDGKEVYSFGKDGIFGIRDDVITNRDSLKELKYLNSDYYFEENYYENISKEELVLDIRSLKKYLNKVIDRLIVIDEGDGSNEKI